MCNQENERQDARRETTVNLQTPQRVSGFARRLTRGRSIDDDLNARGIPSPGARWNRQTRRKDGRWLTSALHAILHNPLYAGLIIWGQSRWVKDPDTGVRERREVRSRSGLATKSPQPG